MSNITSSQDKELIKSDLKNLRYKWFKNTEYKNYLILMYILTMSKSEVEDELTD